MLIHLLGPLEVHLRGDPIALGTPKQRTVFAFLAAHAGRIAPVSDPTAVVRGGGPAESPRLTRCRSPRTSWCMRSISSWSS